MFASVVMEADLPWRWALTWGLARARSEPETAAMLQVAQRFKPHVWMNAHSGMEALFMPCAALQAAQPWLLRCLESCVWCGCG